MTRLVVGPFNRVEGDLEVILEVADEKVREARVSASLFRGFERLLEGRPPTDALVMAPRVCGICSLSHSVAAARALADLAGVRPPPNGERVLNLASAIEVVADHLTHFHLFFMPDFARPAYAGRCWAEGAARFRAGGEAQARFLPVRARFLHLMGLLMGKWPHSLAARPGGVTRAVQSGEKARLTAILRELRTFLETEIHGAPLELFAGLESLDAWEPRGVLGLFLEIARDLGLGDMGAWRGKFLSSGGWAEGGKPLFNPGVMENGGNSPLDVGSIGEDCAHAWLRDGGAPLAPAEGITLPDADKPEGYTWAKAPRLGGKGAEVGALARQVVDGHPLVRDLVRRHGATVEGRVLARFVEVARLVPAMEAWVAALEPGEPFCVEAPLPAQGQGVGLTEAARGMLGHWLTVEGGLLSRYQIVSPTTWNFSPRDAGGGKGPVETVLEGLRAPAGDEAPLPVQHVVRSFDPCMACTVH